MADMVAALKTTHILLNGKPEEIAEQETVASMLERLGLQGKRLALEVNFEVLPRSQYEHTCLQPDDRVEIVYAIGGG